ncbi:MAG: HD domain-containing protein, partial [Firmicutes bacterium]|nr:HD domain-containing protein [Bacillota bacterium]
TDLIKMLDGSRIRSIIRDSKNRMWISTFGENGLIRFDGKTAVKFTAEDGLPSQRARAVYECADGRMLAACTGGVAVIENDKITKVYNEACGISNTEILTVAEGSNGDILVGTDGGGLYVINGDTTEHFSTDNGLPSDVIMRIKKDNTRDIYWLVASNAIAYMTAEHEIKTINKFPYSNNFDLYENGNGDMWILSSSGIYTLPVDELIANGDMSPEFYGRDSGLPCIATSNSYSELTDNGDLYIAGSTGVVKVNIDDPYEKTAEIKISIPYIETDGTKVYPDETGSFRIPSNVKKLTIYSYVYNYSLINPNVTYYLDGFENTAVTVKRSELAPISYTNLRGGSYTFRIRTDSDTGGQVSSYEVKITKEKAFYEHIWFHITALLLIGALFLAGAFGYIHYRNIQFLKKEREQDQFIEEIVEAFAKVIDMKDRYTNGHSFRVANYTRMLAKELGCDDDTANLYYRIALLHDIGKIGVPEDILNKPGKLSDMEFNRIKSHSSLGYDVLKSISIMPEFAKGARAHHERPDGKGYPLGLTLEKIPRVAQIIAVADTFDAMYSDRPYRKRMNFEKAVSIVQEVSGTQLASDVVDAFMRLVAKGEFRAPDDDGGGTTENIDNIRAKFKE